MLRTELTLERSYFLSGQRTMHTFPNLLAEVAVYLFRR